MPYTPEEIARVNKNAMELMESLRPLLEKADPPDKWAKERQAFESGEVVQWRWASASPVDNWMDLKVGATVSWGVWYEFRVKPLPDPEREALVPLEASDVPPGSAVGGRSDDANDSQWHIVVHVCTDGLVFMNCSGLPRKRTFQQLKDGDFVILRPGQADWQPCSKSRS